VGIGGVFGEKKKNKMMIMKSGKRRRIRRQRIRRGPSIKLFLPISLLPLPHSVENLGTPLKYVTLWN